MIVQGGDRLPPPNQMTSNPKTLEEFNEFIEPLIKEVKEEKKYDLTDKELKLAECGGIKFEYFFEETGYDNVDGDPYLCCFTIEQALETTDFNKHQIAGLISSLDEKGVLYIEHRDPIMEGPDLYYLSTGFINFIARKNIAEGKGRYVFAKEEAK